MSFQFDGGRLSGGHGGERPGAGDPFRILVMGDFSGRASRGVVKSLADRTPVKVDIDNLDDLPKSFGTAIIAAGMQADILQLDDFHPDELYSKHELFDALRQLRRKLMDPKTLADAANEIRSWAGHAPPEPQSSDAGTAGDAGEPPASDFEALLSGTTSAGSQRPSKHATTVDALIKQIVGPFVTPGADPQQAELLETLDRATAAQMRRILHDDAWQATEAAWRGVQMLCQRIELDESLTLHVLDVSREELAADAGGLGEVLVHRPTRVEGGQPWSLLVSLETFGPSDEDATLAATLASIAAAAGAPLVAAGHHSLLAPETPAQLAEPASHRAWPAGNWADLAGTADAASLGLALPRFMLRLPYGTATDPIDRFDFEELDETTDHAGYLWAPGSLLAAIVLADGFRSVGWRLRPTGGGEIDDLPVHVLPDRSGEGDMKPCAEVWLADTAYEAIMDRNLIPIVSIQRRGAVRVAALKSIAGGALAARWG
ncbi:MAG: type VI secretion system contractile sheath large subunit [Planctomycetota bacterium]